MSKPPNETADSSTAYESLPDFLQVLPQTTVRYNFIDHNDLVRKITAYEASENSNQFLIFLHVPEKEIEQVTDDSAFPFPGIRISYERTTQTLFIKMPKKAHEVAIDEFRYLLNKKFDQMNMISALNKTGSTTRKQGNWTKEPDASWEPKPITNLNDQLPFTETQPSLILEVGCSETANKLIQDARGWIEAAGSQTRIVLTVKIEEKNPTITIQVWGRASPTPNFTRQYRASAVIQQQVQVTARNKTINVSGNISLDFAKIFLRPADPRNTVQQNIIINQQELKSIAQEVWEAQKFM